MDILRDLADISFRILDKMRFVPALENMSARGVAVVVHTGKRGKERSHVGAKVRLLCPKVDVDVVDHQAVCPDIDPEQFRKMNHPVQKQFLVGIIPENRQPGVTPADDMVAGAWKFDAQRSGHGRDSFDKTARNISPCTLKLN